MEVPEKPVYANRRIPEGPASETFLGAVTLDGELAHRPPDSGDLKGIVQTDTFPKRLMRPVSAARFEASRP